MTMNERKPRPRYIVIRHLVTKEKRYLDLADVGNRRWWEEVYQKVQPTRWEVLKASDTLEEAQNYE